MESTQEQLTALAVTTAGIMLVLAAIHGPVKHDISHIFQRCASSIRDDYFLSLDDEVQDDMITFAALRGSMQDESAVAIELSCGNVASDLRLLGMNVGQWYMKPRSLTWFETFVETVYDDERWKRLFRVGRETFLYLVTSLGDRLQTAPPPSLAGAIPTRLISVTKQMAVALYKLGHGSSNFTVAELFGMGESTVSDVLWRVCQAIVAVERPRTIRWPAEGAERAAAIASMQAVHGLPNCVGAVDCTHIVHDLPAGYPATCFYDRDHNYSTVLQIVGDVSGSFKVLLIIVSLYGFYELINAH
jgi:hypothetical protein